MQLAIYTCATAKYTYALKAQAHRVMSNLEFAAQAGYELDVLVLLVGDGSDQQLEAVQLYQELLPSVLVESIEQEEFNVEVRNYEHGAQLLIAQMRTAATRRVISWGADVCWVLDSDVLPPPNALRCLLDVLKFDDGYYGVAASPYPSQGGGPFLCGRGTDRNHILPCFYEEERKVPKELLAKATKLENQINDRAKSGKEPTPHMLGKIKDIRKAIDGCPPKENIFSLNGKKWRQRGWFDNAYPAIGKGAIVPSDWCGFGCTLLSRKALSLCDWAGYDGSGTEDLYIVWKKWYPNGIKIAAVPHCPSDHVIRSKEDKTKYIHIMAGHENSGECIGHLRQEHRPWYDHSVGEKFNPKNDGKC